MSLVIEAQLADLEFHKIPVIDFSEISKPQNLQCAAAREKLVAEIRDACVRVGFFYVKNYDIGEHIIDRVLAAMQEYFARPEEEKMKLSAALVNKGGLPIKGYIPLLQGRVSGRGQDLNEGFLFGFDRGKDETHYWPGVDNMEEFREAALDYYKAATGLGDELYRLLAESLELPTDWFKERTKSGKFAWKSLYYPPQNADDLLNPENTTLGIGEHADWVGITILWQQYGRQALQVVNPAGKWVDAPALPGTFIVNIAESITRLTNGIYQCTKHRVINKSGEERYSMPIFFGLDYDVLLEPIPSCVSPERPFKYEVITEGEHLQRKITASRYGSY